MTSQIVLPTLTQWTKNHITAIIQATKQTDLNSAIDAFLSKDATIVVNGAKISRAEFVNQVQIEKFDEAGAAISFAASIEVPTDTTKPFDASPTGRCTSHN
jgi:predicted benzoate:H+ symporter BenE